MRWLVVTEVRLLQIRFAGVIIKAVLLAPTFEDEDLLPEVTAFVLEAYRWRPVSAGG